MVTGADRRNGADRRATARTTLDRRRRPESDAELYALLYAELNGVAVRPTPRNLRDDRLTTPCCQEVDDSPTP